jgi:hypothetical protein
MAKRAEETKMKQVSEERELKPVKDIAEDPDDDRPKVTHVGLVELSQAPTAAFLNQDSESE